MATTKNGQNNIKQEIVTEWFDRQFKVIKNEKSKETKKDKKEDNRGPDRKITRNKKTYFFEAIGWTHKPRGKNQSDFWKAFSQALARLNPESEWGKPDVSVILLPDKFLDGWDKRVSQLGKIVWEKIGEAFPTLEIWFISASDCQEFSWKKAFEAGKK